MGEEKPDEELMGKRKSSPRLSTTFDDVDNFRIADSYKIIRAGTNCFSFHVEKIFTCRGENVHLFILLHN